MAHIYGDLINDILTRVEREPSSKRTTEESARMRSKGFSITVNGQPVRVAEGTSVAAAMMMANEPCWFALQRWRL